MEEDEVVEEVKDPEKIAVHVLDIAIDGSALKTALDVLFVNTFGNKANKKIYALQKGLQPHIEEYAHLRSKLAKDPDLVENGGATFNKTGMVHVQNLNETVGMKEVELECELPIKLKFLDCFSSNNRIVLEAFGIAEFED